jgi:hypothetical protein
MNQYEQDVACEEVLTIVSSVRIERCICEYSHIQQIAGHPQGEFRWANPIHSSMM